MGVPVRDAKLVARAQAMRRDATPPERALWRILRAPPFDALHFRRQVPFGSLYIADFASHRARIVIEADGRSHDAPASSDAARDRWFEAQGYRVYRLSNAAIMDPNHDVARTLGNWFRA